MEEEQERILSELMILSNSGKISYTPTQLKKMKPTRREIILQEFERQQLDEVNEAVADMVVIKFEELMKSFDLIKENSPLARKLQDRNLFMRDVKNVVSYVTPFLPFVGLLEGALVTSTEIIDHYKNKSQQNEGNTSATSKGEESGETPGDESEHNER